MDPARRRFLRGDPNPKRAASAPRPPWALRPDALFLDACTRCGDCVRACSERVVRVGDGGYPEVRFAEAGCTLCGDCRRACAAGVLAERAGQAPFEERVAVADSCLSQHGVECRLCGDACDARALRFVPAPGGIARLRVMPEACTGCGQCVAPCPVGAITLRR